MKLEVIFMYGIPFAKQHTLTDEENRKLQNLQNCNMRLFDRKQQLCKDITWIENEMHKNNLDIANIKFPTLG